MSFIGLGNLILVFYRDVTGYGEAAVLGDDEVSGVGLYVHYHVAGVVSEDAAGVGLELFNDDVVSFSVSLVGVVLCTDQCWINLRICCQPHSFECV